jgi:hypothetical protein
MMFFVLGIGFFLLNVAIVVGLIWLERVFSVPQYAWLGTENSYVVVLVALIVTMLLLMPISRRFYPRGRPRHPRLSPILTVANTAACLGLAVWFWLRPHPTSMRVVGLVLFASGALSVYGSVRDRLARGR